MLFNRKIDLLTERSLSNPYFTEGIHSSKKLIYDERHQKISVDIKTAIHSIEDYVESIDSFEEYQQNKLIRRAEEREIEIIGEATNRILKLDEAINIEHARKIVDTRNWVIHGYE